MDFSHTFGLKLVWATPQQALAALINNISGCESSYIRCDRVRAIIRWMSEQYDHMISNTDGGCNVEGGGALSEWYSTCTGQSSEKQKLEPAGFTWVNIVHRNKTQATQCCFLRVTMKRGLFHLLTQVQRPWGDFSSNKRPSLSGCTFINETGRV